MTLTSHKPWCEKRCRALPSPGVEGETTETSPQPSTGPIQSPEARCERELKCLGRDLKALLCCAVCLRSGCLVSPI